MTQRRALEQLLNALVGQAERTLRAHGDFFPFGGVRYADGRMEAVAVPLQEAPDSLEAWRDWVLLRLRSLAATEPDCEAVALVLHVEVDVPTHPEPVPGIQVTLEHRDGRAHRVFIPYRGRGGGLELGEAFVDRSPESIFPRPDGLPLRGAA